MARNIVILNGSPRIKGNTAALADAFTRGAEEAGHTVVRFDLQKLDIHPCSGCWGGGKDPQSPCVQKDGMEQIYAAFNTADVVVFASPVYYWSFSAQLKMVLDRLLAVMESRPTFSMPARDCVLLLAAASDTPENFAPVVGFYETMVARLQWKDLGRVCAGGVMKPGDIDGKPALEEARALGASLK